MDFIDGPYWAKMFVLCFYTIWVVMPFKVLILTSALASVNQVYYNAARVDGTSPVRIFRKITLPMISPMIFYLVITGFIGAFKAYSDAVALFGTNLNAAEMNTIVGYVYDMLYGRQRRISLLCLRGGDSAVRHCPDDYLYQSAGKQKSMYIMYRKARLFS